MISRCKPLLGTFVEIKILQETLLANQAIEEAFAVIEKIQKLMSFFDEDSEISRLNKMAHESSITVNPQLFEVLTLAQKISQISNGVFDITLHRSEQNCSSADIKLLENFQVKFTKPLRLDLGGIAKGYAVDCAALLLERRGITDYIVNAGGDLRVGNTLQKISIRNPKNPGAVICETEICSGALATSAGYFSYQEIEKEKIYPIFDQYREALKYKGESASVFAKNCAIADALTKVVLILEEGSEEILFQFDAQAMLINSAGVSKLIN